MENLKITILSILSVFKQGLFSSLLLGLIFLSLLSLSYAATPNPGHPWTESGDGNFIVTGPTVPRTYTFPNESTSVLTDNAVLTIAQGGTGTSSLTGILVGGGYGNPFTATSAPSGLLVGDSDTQTLTNKTINIDLVGMNFHNGLTGVNLFGSDGTKFIASSSGSALQLLRTNAAATALEWVANPFVVAGSTQQLQFNSGGTALGATSSLAWDNSAQALKLDGILELATSTPSTATTGTMKLVNQKVANRSMLGVVTDSSTDQYSLQPSLFQNFFILMTTGSSITPRSFGTNIGSSGTVSHPTATEASGYLINFAAAAVSTTAAGFQTPQGLFYRGSTDGMNGFFMFARVFFPDTSYNQTGPGTGSRLYVGFGNVNGVANAAVSDNPATDWVGFSRNSTNDGRQDTYWTLMTKDNTTLSLATTTTAFATSTLYDMYLYCPPQGSAIGWRLDDLTNSTTEEGLLTANLPRGSSAMSVGAYVGGVNNVSRNIRVQKIYVEVPR